MVRMVALEIMNTLRHFSAATTTDHAVDTIRKFVHFCRARGNLTDQEITEWEIRAESMAVTKRSDLQVAKRRYENFCESVVKRFLELPH